MKKLLTILALWGLLAGLSSIASAGTIDGVSDESKAKSFLSMLINLEMTNNNTADLKNNVQTRGNTGGNSFAVGDDGEGLSLETGDASSALLVDNTANSNFVETNFEAVNGSSDTISNISDQSEATATTTDDMLSKMQNNNDAKVENDTNAEADSGNNTLSSVDSMTNTKAITGAAEAVSGLQNLFNNNLLKIIRSIAD